MIHVENIGKKYYLNQHEDSLFGKLKTGLQNVTNRRKQNNVYDNEFWALKNITFDVRAGDVVGIIGRNGAGKSTLLKILSRITPPTEGLIRIHGQMASLLEVGTGFHPELNGRENIYLNGAILGMDRKYIKSRFDEIVEFSGIEKFIDTPVKHYSSGMYVRLAFSVAAHLEPEILLVDEVLAVGDMAFQKKCIGKIQDVAGHGRTVLFVSHNMNTISRLCNRVILLSGGMIVDDGDAENVISNYITSSSTKGGEKIWDGGWSNEGIEDFKLLAVRVKNHLNHVTDQIESTKEFLVEIVYQVNNKLRNSRVGFQIVTIEGIILFESYDTDFNVSLKNRNPGIYTTSCTIPSDLLSEGQYLLSVNAGIPKIRNLAFSENVIIFHIIDSGTVGSELISKHKGLIRPKLHWKSNQNTHY